VRDLLVNLVASALAGLAVWVAQRVLAHRRLTRKRAFFGLKPGEPALLVVARHASSPREQSVHRRDVAALVELAAVVRECGGRSELVAPGASTGLGKMTEFCVGGRETNPRAAAHLRAMLPGVEMTTYQESGRQGSVSVGPHRFVRDPERVEYAVLARTVVNDHMVFSILGQTSFGNLAAVRYLAAHQRSLQRRYGVTAFCLVLRVVEPDAYGADLVEVAADVSADAFAARESTPDARPGVPRQARLDRVFRRGAKG
jgi:hypothetical protein